MNAWIPALLTTSVLIGCTSGCTNRDTADSDRATHTPLPTRQTTIDPVTKKLDTAREDAERRRRQVDEAAK
ncbi:MAG: hypothetical protein H0V63_14165 [Burkholderiaceae bacterium]|nr:hypothetical protein [Burkholderiaceae bacterium]